MEIHASLERESHRAFAPYYLLDVCKYAKTKPLRYWARVLVETGTTPAPEVHVFPGTGIRIVGTESWVERLDLAA